MIKPPVRNSVTFLQQHIQEDLAQLMRILGKSVDETINILHLVLSSLLKDQHPGQCKEAISHITSASCVGILRAAVDLLLW